VAVLLGILVAASFGSGDFLGGRASARASTPAVLLVSQATAVLGAVVVAVSVGAHVTSQDLVFGVIAGTANVCGLGFLYYGLAHGRIGVVAPVTAVVGALVPVTWAVARGERPSAFVWAGVSAAIVAAALIARAGDAASAEEGGRSGVVVAIAAGVGLGCSFIFFAKTSPSSGFWPVLSARAAAVVAVGAAVLVLRPRREVEFPRDDARLLALGAGALDVPATALLLLAVRRGLAVVVAPVASLAPAATVGLAWLVLRERMVRGQLIGLGIAAVALVLIATG
jgi:drug/metabolite transporter (DMT)-like permease